MSEVSFICGARVGWIRASWPFAKLTASHDRLILTSLGTYEFAPEQVEAIERYGYIPILAWGLRIRHNRADYPKSVIFWCMGSRDRVLTEIKQTGFTPKGQSSNTRPRAFPIRWTVVVGVVIVWTLLSILDRALSTAGTNVPGPFGLLALLLLFAFVTAVLSSARLQRAVLRDGHHLSEIKGFLRLLQLTTGLLCAIFAVVLWET